MEAPDPGLLIIPQRDALASGLEPLLLQLQVTGVLIVNGSCPTPSLVVASMMRSMTEKRATKRVSRG